MGPVSNMQNGRLGRVVVLKKTRPASHRPPSKEGFYAKSVMTHVLSHPPSSPAPLSISLSLLPPSSTPICVCVEGGSGTGGSLSAPAPVHLRLPRATCAC
jgi:hypothetical protein